MLNLQSVIVNWRNVPQMVRIVFIFSAIAMTISGDIIGFSVSALGWIIPLLFALNLMIFRLGRIKFPVLLWLPWIVLVSIYLFFADAQNAIQRTIMLLSPLATGMAVSKLNIGKLELDALLSICRYFSVLLIGIVILNSGLLLTGQLPEQLGMATEVMTAALFCSLFAASFADGNKRALFWWAMLLLLPILAMTRTVIVVAALSLPLTLAPLGMLKRLIILLLIAALGLILFNTERVQNKMFFSHQGTLSDIRRDNPDFRTTGRITILNALEVEVDAKPWFGHGANASEDLVSRLTGGLTHPHNDWLRFLYDYGYVGAGIFALCLVLQVLHAWWHARKTSGVTRILFYAGASSFVLFAMIMFTDNIVLYGAYFGNLQFAILGMAYAAFHAKHVPDGDGV